jgi:dolichol-phosphate mannosyltransferase
MKSVVILPMYNEEENAPRILAALSEVRKKNGLDLDVIAVNDGSTDATAEVLNRLAREYPNLIVISYEENKGMGGAMVAGIERALDGDFDILIFMDSDLTHDCTDIPAFLGKITEGYDYVLGSRFIKGGKMVGVPLARAAVSDIGNILGKILLWIPVHDYTSGFRAGRRKVFETIQLTEKGFGVQLEATVRTAAAGFKLGEVPMVLTTRKFGESKMNYRKIILPYIGLLLKCTWWRHVR